MPDADLLISAQQLHSLAADPTLRIVDCCFDLLAPDSGRQQYLQGHVPAAVYADLDKDLAAPRTVSSGRHPLPDVDEFARTLGRLGISNSSRVVVYDAASGALAARLWWLLRWAGHDDVQLLDGGIGAWQAEGLPLETGEDPPAAATFHIQPRHELVLETDEIVAAGETLQLVDAREAQRFLGDSEPIDTVAGHIPGALNLPFGSSLNADGSWKDRECLVSLWRDLLGEGLGRPWAVTCGSGVTACHLAISGLLAGLPEPRVYVGSWSEWITDPSRPVA